MADKFIKCEDAVDAIRGKCFTMSMCVSVDECKGMRYAQDLFAKAVERVPAADVRPVVFCKGCKSCNTDIAVDGWYGMCAFWNGHSVMADDYCSRFRNKDSADMREVDDG